MYVWKIVELDAEIAIANVGAGIACPRATTGRPYNVFRENINAE